MCAASLGDRNKTIISNVFVRLLMHYAFDGITETHVRLTVDANEYTRMFRLCDRLIRTLRSAANFQFRIVSNLCLYSANAQF